MRVKLSIDKNPTAPPEPINPDQPLKDPPMQEPHDPQEKPIEG